MQNETFMTYLATKVPFGIGAAFTASVVSTLWVPKKLKRRGAVAAGVIIGGTSVGASFAFGGLFKRTSSKIHKKQPWCKT